MTIQPFIKDRTYLRHFWHVVATVQELERANPSGVGPMPARLLGENLVLAKLDGKYVAMRDRCCHRSAKLSVGKVQGNNLECPYHGWQYNGAGVCEVIPACPDLKIPSKARIDAFECQEKYGLLWVRLDSTYGCAELPVFPEFDDATMRVIHVDPYDWNTSSERRWENFTDFSHFAFVHPTTLYDPAYVEPPIAPVDRVDGQLCFRIEPPKEMLDNLPELSPLGAFTYRCTMPFTIHFQIDLYKNDNRYILWTTSCPMDEFTCRNFLIIVKEAHDDKADYSHIAFHKNVLAEDEPIITSQWPTEPAADELSMITDKVSIQYRKWLRELSLSALAGADDFRKTLRTNVIDPLGRASPDGTAAQQAETADTAAAGS